jgi:AcrR family transcriptional regulator
MTIDHQKRRREIAELAIGLIATEGVGAATIRRIAARAGFSTAAITRYFRDKDELLLWTFEVLSAEGERRFEDAMRIEPFDVINPLLTLVPWCPANVRRWRAYLAFWDEATRNAALAALFARSTETGVRFFEELFRACGVAEASQEAMRFFNAVIQGFAMQMLLAPDDWPEELVRERLRTAFRIHASRQLFAADPPEQPARPA